MRSDAKQLGDLPELLFNTSAVLAKINVEWFCNLTDAQRLQAATQFPKKSFSDCETIATDGAFDGVMHVIVSGQVQECTSKKALGGVGTDDASAPEGGRGNTMRILAAGDQFNASSLVEKRQSKVHPVHYVAKGAVVCVSITRATLREFADHTSEKPELLEPSKVTCKFRAAEATCLLFVATFPLFACRLAAVSFSNPSSASRQPPHRRRRSPWTPSRSSQCLAEVHLVA